MQSLVCALCTLLLLVTRLLMKFLRAPCDTYVVFDVGLLCSPSLNSNCYFGSLSFT